MMKIMYHGTEITQRANGKYYLESPVNGTQRIFPTLEMAKKYIDNAEALDSHARAMGW